jgi:hypothetical protein
MDREKTASLASSASSASSQSIEKSQELKRPAMNRTKTGNDTIVKQPPHQQGINIEDQYYTYNPWHDEGPEKPVFGLAKPLPRTVRSGMIWGREEAQKNDKPTHKSPYRESKKHSHTHAAKQQSQQGGHKSRGWYSLLIPWCRQCF